MSTNLEKEIKDMGTNLYLGGRGFGDEGAKLFAKELMNPDTKVENVRLCGNNIRLQGVTAIAKALEVNVTVKA